MKENNNDDLIEVDQEEERKDNLVSEDEERVSLIDKKTKEEKQSKDSLLNILQHLEKDLILKNNCTKEFDLNQNYENKYQKTEVFGNPCCYICFSNNRDDSSFQLFHCSHCNKLFCKECLSIHYKSKFKNIEDSYMKYIKEGSKEELIDKNLPKTSGNCRLIFFLILIFLFNFFYLLSIFAVKPILTSLEIIMMNCVKEIFTYKVEEPDSLFNFYDIFFDKVNTLNLDFDIMMIMNWLGDKILDSCGFVPSIIIFIIINIGYFFAMFNFDFMKYNENNKYSAGKFVQLLILYLTIFIGVGSSSLLSQQIFIEFFKKYKNIVKEKEKNELNKNNNNKITGEENNGNFSINNDNSEALKPNENLLFKYKDIEVIVEDNNNKKPKKENELNTSVNIDKVEATKNKRIKLGAFFSITLITFLSFFANFFINLWILNSKYKKDEKIFNKYNETILFDNYTNSNITRELYESDKIFFTVIYSFYYISCMIISINLYLMIFCCCLRKKKEEKKKDNQFLLIYSDEIINEYNLKNRQNTDIIDINLIKEIEEDKRTNNYTICKFCGFFYFCLKSDLRGENSCCSKFGYCLKDFFVLNCKSLIDFCDITFCQVFDIIFCAGKKKCNCVCCDNIEYNKKKENFCFCYQEKRKYKWFHDYITSEVQKDVAPYILEYFLLGLLIISFQKKFVDFKVTVPKRNESILDDNLISVEEIIQIWNNWKIMIIIVLTLIIFFLLTRTIRKINLKDPISAIGKKPIFKSYTIFNGIHILLLINSIISLFFSLLYILGIKDFGDYIIIPILMYQYFSFSLNYYCICVTDQENNHELILSGGILVSIYLKIWSIIYSLIQSFSENETEKYIYYFQGILSITIIVLFIIYLIFTKFKYVICYNCVNMNLCGFCQVCGPCCKYNTFCIDGYQYCFCCCCDDKSSCFSDQCVQSHFLCCGCCSCFSEKNEEENSENENNEEENN